MTRRRWGIGMFGVLGLVMIGLGILASFSLRTRALKTHRLHLEAELRARYAMESARELATDMVLAADPETWRQVALEGALARVLLGDPDPASGKRLVLAYGESGGVGNLLIFSILKDAPLIEGGPPRPGALRVEDLRDLSYTGAAIPDRALPPAERTALLEECVRLRSHMNGQELLLRQEEP